MKNLFLTAVLFLTAFTASAQIGNVKESNGYIQVFDYSGKRISTNSIQTNYETYLGSSTSFYCVMSKSGGTWIYIYDALGKRTGIISINGGDSFSNISGSSINLKCGSNGWTKRYDSTGKYLGVN
jgi:hypothetical protein